MKRLEELMREYNGEYAEILKAEVCGLTTALAEQTAHAEDMQSQYAIARAAMAMQQGLDAEAPATAPCGIAPPTPGYAPCTRDKGHEGPCAHPLAASIEGKITEALGRRWPNLHMEGWDDDEAAAIIQAAICAAQSPPDPIQKQQAYYCKLCNAPFVNDNGRWSTTCDCARTHPVALAAAQEAWDESKSAAQPPPLAAPGKGGGKS